MESKTLIEVVKKLTGRCFPYGETTIDEERYDNLLLRMDIVDALIDEITEAGRLYKRKEFSIKHISNKANQYLTDLRDYLVSIDYLP